MRLISLCEMDSGHGVISVSYKCKIKKHPAQMFGAFVQRTVYVYKIEAWIMNVGRIRESK